MRRVAVVSVTVLLLMGVGEVGASAFYTAHAVKVHSRTKSVAETSTPGSPRVKPGTGAKERADANALIQAQKHRHGIAPRHKRHSLPRSTATPASTSTP